MLIGYAPYTHGTSPLALFSLQPASLRVLRCGQRRKAGRGCPMYGRSLSARHSREPSFPLFPAIPVPLFPCSIRLPSAPVRTSQGTCGITENIDLFACFPLFRHLAGGPPAPWHPTHFPPGFQCARIGRITREPRVCRMTRMLLCFHGGIYQTTQTTWNNSKQTCWKPSRPRLAILFS